jgi:hypothetical protein
MIDLPRRRYTRRLGTIVSFELCFRSKGDGLPENSQAEDLDWARNGSVHAAGVWSAASPEEKTQIANVLELEEFEKHHLRGQLAVIRPYLGGATE